MVSRLFAPGLRPAWRGLLVLLYLAITYLALVPKPPEGLSTGWDKSNHLLAFACLAIVSVMAHWQSPKQWWQLASVLLLYAIGIELAQHFLPPRSADWLDVVADMTGAAAGLGLAAISRHQALKR
jgi:VanZ family protein